MSDRIGRFDERVGREERILDAVLTLLSRDGISGVSFRSVAREAGVALGLVSYYYNDKVTLIAAALRRIEKDDLTIVEADPRRTPEENLRRALRRVASPQFLTTEYLTLRLQLWALAGANAELGQINTAGQQRYRVALAELIRAVHPTMSKADAMKRATDIDIVQNGMWLTSLLGINRATIRRSVAQCEEIAFG